MNAVIIFNISNNQEEIVKNGMIARGYFNYWVVAAVGNTPAVPYDLPTNCVWKANTEFQTALNDLNSVVAQLNIDRTPPLTVTRYVALSSVPWIASRRQ